MAETVRGAHEAATEVTADWAERAARVVVGPPQPVSAGESADRRMSEQSELFIASPFATPVEPVTERHCPDLSRSEAKRSLALAWTALETGNPAAPSMLAAGEGGG